MYNLMNFRAVEAPGTVRLPTNKEKKTRSAENRRGMPALSVNKLVN